MICHLSHAFNVGPWTSFEISSRKYHLFKLLNFLLFQRYSVKYIDMVVNAATETDRILESKLLVL